MKLFFSDNPPDVPRILDGTRKAYGISHPERVNGFAGTFLFTLLDVYVSDGIERLLEREPGFGDCLREMLQRFKHNDYGDVSEPEGYENTEQRYFAGTHRLMIARYQTPGGLVCFEAFHDRSLLYFSGEDIRAVREDQDRKWEDARNR